MGDIVNLEEFKKAKAEGRTLPSPCTIEVKEFKMDLDGLKDLANAEKMTTDEMLKILPDEIIEAVFADVTQEMKNDGKVSDVHDACFEVQLLAEQYPKHAEYIEKQIQYLVKQIILYVHNQK